MQAKGLAFGQSIDGYAVPVLNERAVRAAAGILFFAALVSFMNAWLQGNFRPTRLFVTAFVIDFVIRVAISPRYAPSLVVGQWFVRHQAPEYVGAPQKRFAWTIGLVLSASMFYLVVLHRIVGPVNLIVCATCLLLLFFEAAFGICLGCKIYNLFMPRRAQLCPGDACEVSGQREAPQRGAQYAVVAVYAAVLAAAAPQVMSGVRDLGGAPAPAIAGPGAAPGAAPGASPRADARTPPQDAERCKVPEFAKAMGHEQLWKLHNGCQ